MIRAKISQIVRGLQARSDRYRSGATFVCVTGSSGKTSTVGMLSHILKGQAPVLSQIIENDVKSSFKMLRAISASHRYVVCEIGAGGPGTLQPMIDLFQPSVGLVTLVGLEHYKSFRSLDAVAKEKQKLVEALPRSGLAILNHDDSRVMAMASRTRACVVTFGTLGGDYRIIGTEASKPGELALTISHAGEVFEIRTRLTGAHNGLVVVAAFACAHQLGVPTSIITDRLGSFQPVFGRCSAHFIESGPVFIVDTAKAPYHSIHLPIDMMEEFIAPRRQIIVGKISDYAGNPYPKYRDVYRASKRVADQVIFVGEDAHRSKAPAEDIAAGRFVEKRSIAEAAEFVRETAIPGEVILLKSSGKLHLERVFINFRQQVHCWEQLCGKGDNCLRCGSYPIPFELRKKMKKQGRLEAIRREADDIYQTLPHGPAS